MMVQSYALSLCASIAKSSDFLYPFFVEIPIFNDYNTIAVAQRTLTAPLRN